MLTTELGEQLRQGDVCSVPNFPRWTLNSTRVEAVKPPLLVVEAWDRPLKSDDGSCLVVVCSYDCDIENPRGRAGLLLAPVMKLPASPGSQEEADILASDLVRDGKIGYANMFPLLLPTEPENQMAVADFSAMATLASAKEANSALTATRIFTMDSNMRLAFKVKLSLFLHRPGEED
ncbi:MAG: hypothetical protein JO045_08260 [Mycobacterium sp.]|nr:hypothetical protein [Mycobacterium sp.]